MKTELCLAQSLHAALGVLALMLACACTPIAQELPSSADTAGSWQLMRHIKLAAFSAGDPGEYDLMIFCDAPDHVRVYHLTPPDPLGAASNLVLRSDVVRAEFSGQREEVRATPPPVSSDPGALLGVRVHTRIAVAAPVMVAFLQSGRLEAQSGRHITRADADARERDMLAAFIGAECSA